MGEVYNHTHEQRNAVLRGMDGGREGGVRESERQRGGGGREEDEGWEEGRRS